MSTIAPNKPDTSDSRRFLARRLGEARSRIKLFDLGTGLAVIAAGAISYTLSIIVLDQLFILSTLVRSLLLIAFILATCGYLWWAVMLPAIRRINLLFAAHTVESADLATKNSLINWLLLSRQPDHVSTGIMTAIEARAARDLARIDLRSAINAEHLVRISYVLAAVVVVFCAYTFFTTKELTPSLVRVLMPFREVAPPTNTRFNDIQPGSTTIAAGEKVAISGYATGRQPDRVTAFVSPDNGEYWEPNPLEPPQQKNGRWQVTLLDRQRPFDYYVTANDFTSPKYRVDVTAAPVITQWQVTYHYPAYTGQTPRTEGTGDIDGIEGSVVDVAASTNVAVGSGKLDLTLGKKFLAVEMRVPPDDQQKLIGSFPLTEDGSYQINFTDGLGRRPQVRPVKTIRVRKDLTPTLTFIEPQEPEIARPANGAVRFHASISDDFGLKSVRLVLQRHNNARILLEHERDGRTEPLGATHSMVVPVDLGSLALQAGDVVQYWAEAVDNKLPTPNRVDTRSEPRLIRITSPVDANERDKQIAEATQKPKQEPDDSSDESQKQVAQASPDEMQNQKDQDQGEQQKPKASDDAKSKDQPDKQESSNTEASSRDDQKTLERVSDFLNTKDEKAEPKPNAQDKQTKSKENKQEKGNDEPGQAGDEQKSAKEGERKGSPSSQADSKQKHETQARQQPGVEKAAGTKAKDEKSSNASEPSEEGKDRKEADGSAGKSSTDSSASSNERKGEMKSEPSPSEETKDKRPSSEQTKGDASKKDEPDKAERRADDKAKAGKADAKGSDEGAAAGANKGTEDEPQKGSDGNQESKASGKSESEKQSMKKPGDASGAESSKGDDKEGASPESQQSKKDGNVAGDRKAGNDQVADATAKKAGEPKESMQGQNKAASEQGDGQKQSSPKPTDGNEQKKDRVAPSASDAKKQEKSGQDKTQPAKDSPPAGEEGSDENATKKSSKMGKQDPASSSGGNTEGKASSGDSSKSGQSDSNTPAGAKGEKPGQSGEKPGQSEGEQESESKGKGEGKGQQPSEKGTGQSGEGKGDKKGDGKGEGKGDGKGNEPKSESGKGEGESGGEPGEKAGDANAGGKKPGEQPGEGQQGEAGSGKGKQGEGEGKGESKGKGQGEGDGKSQSQGKADSKPGGQSTGGGNQSGEDGPRSAVDRPTQDNIGDAANPEDRKKATNLVLKRLEDALKQKQIDPELLKRSGMTEEQFRKWGERVLKPPAEKADDPLVGKGREGFGKGRGLRTNVTRSANTTAQDDQQNLFQGRRADPPDEYKTLFEAYTRSLSKRQPARKASAETKGGTKVQ